MIITVCARLGSQEDIARYILVSKIIGNVRQTTFT